MFLLSCVSAETISSVHGKINQITRYSFGSLSHGGRFRRAAPFNARAVWIDQLRIEPLHNDFLIIGGVRTVTRCVRRRRLGIRTDAKSHSQRERANERLPYQRFHVFSLSSWTAASPA